MMKKLLLLFFFSVCTSVTAQETFPVNFDYLSDNIYLIHPAAAGIGNCSKIRLTYGQQWLGMEDGPSLQTLSYHDRITERAAVGAIVFNDKNGYHSKWGFTGTYAYHINFDREDMMNQLSFGLSLMYLQNSLDQTDFVTDDPSLSGELETGSYYNADFGLGYHYFDAHSYFTVKNILNTPRELNTGSLESDNLRRYMLTLGYYFGREKSFQLEPSVMGQFVEETGEILVDFNFKVYKSINAKNQIWAAVSYRQSFEDNPIESLKLVTPILGFTFNKWMVSYTYTHQVGDVVINTQGSHQFTLGFNLFCQKPRATACPNLNSVY